MQNNENNILISINYHGFALGAPYQMQCEAPEDRDISDNL
jgi:hypothetical protein